MPRCPGFVQWSLLVTLAVLLEAPGIAAEPGSRRVGPSGIVVEFAGDASTAPIVMTWPIAKGQTGRLALDPRVGKPLIESLAIVDESRGAMIVPLLKDVDPEVFLTVGTRVAPDGRPPAMSPFNTFFDAPAQRPHETYKARLGEQRRVDVDMGNHGTIRLDGLVAGPFSGSLEFQVYPGSALVHVEAVVSTSEDRRAYLYDFGLVAHGVPSWESMAWLDTEDHFQRRSVQPDDADGPLAVRHRTLVAEGKSGSVACFPPPHRYFFARDLTDNLQYVWFGTGHRGLEPRYSFGIRQSETGGGSFAPWFNAPPGTKQRLGMFLLVSTEKAHDALREVRRYTHGDRFPELPGHVTFTTHWHMELALAAMKEVEAKAGRTIPDLVKIFKDMNVNIVHLGEFHGDGHPRDPGPLRLAELDALFAECRRLSSQNLLLLPGEEANAYLGIHERGKQPGHWMLLFPRPVYWTMVRGEGQPFAEAHPRIKASSWAPDGYKDEAFYASDSWLGAAWKALPSDLSQPRLGTRALDLMDDMANWGPRKYVPGEVDVFKIDHTHELYGHMNVNYLRLDRIPRFNESWQPVLDALRGGRFFVTTGEILIRQFSVGGAPSGGTLALSDDGRAQLALELEWTFPLEFAELVSGDGRRVYRERIALDDTREFGRREWRLNRALKGRTWVRAEAWDVAANGAFTQPVWLEPR